MSDTSELEEGSGKPKRERIWCNKCGGSRIHELRTRITDRKATRLRINSLRGGRTPSGPAAVVSRLFLSIAGRCMVLKVCPVLRSQKCRFIPQERMPTAGQIFHEAACSVIKAIQRSDRSFQFGLNVAPHHRASCFDRINRSVNSLVPYEATKVRLGPQEYLVWFEGIYPDKPTVTKAFPGPTHLQFLRVNDERPEPAEERELLQDLVNLSGANWRGFNAKSSPVSVFYCHLVADLVHNFHERGLPMPAVQDIQPWFL